ncbi:hypothetical protein PMI11_05451 [Rhizobium sp. CF142]|nr:hypothetical protein PMI11_05451 [Rhizobium sp. CF142]
MSRPRWKDETISRVQLEHFTGAAADQQLRRSFSHTKHFVSARVIVLIIENTIAP